MMTILFFSSCKREESVNIDQNRIYSNYEFAYDANVNKSSMTATFRLDNNSGQNYSCLIHHELILTVKECRTEVLSVNTL